MSRSTHPTADPTCSSDELVLGQEKQPAQDSETSFCNQNSVICFVWRAQNIPSDGITEEWYLHSTDVLEFPRTLPRSAHSDVKWQRIHLLPPRHTYVHSLDRVSGHDDDREPELGMCSVYCLLLPSFLEAQVAVPEGIAPLYPGEINKTQRSSR